MDMEYTICYVRSYFLVLNEILQFLLIPSIAKVEYIWLYSSELSLRLSNSGSKSTFFAKYPPNSLVNKESNLFNEKLMS